MKARRWPARFAPAGRASSNRRRFPGSRGWNLGALALAIAAAVALWLAGWPSQKGDNAAGIVRWDDLELLSRVVAAEAQGEPWDGQVAVAAVVLNRVRHPQFPNTVSGVVYQPRAFESVSNGLIWRRTPTARETEAARAAMNGVDPSYGSLFFWNPSKPVSPWVWTRQIVVRIGNHVFAR